MAKLTKNMASLSILVCEVQDLLADKSVKTAKGLARRINGALDTWVSANRLHPERARGVSLSKLIRDIQSTLAYGGAKSAVDLAKHVNAVLNSWIEKNELHPERCKRMSMGEFRHWLRVIELEERPGQGVKAPKKKQ